MPAISDARILIIATNGFEDSELLEPRKRLLEAGAKVMLASPRRARSRASRRLMTPEGIDDVAVAISTRC